MFQTNKENFDANRGFLCRKIQTNAGVFQEKPRTSPVLIEKIATFAQKPRVSSEIPRKNAPKQKKTAEIAKIAQKALNFEEIVAKIKEINPVLKQLFENRGNFAINAPKVQQIQRKKRKKREKPGKVAQKPSFSVETTRKPGIDALISSTLKRIRREKLEKTLEIAEIRREKVEKSLKLRAENAKIREINRKRFVNAMNCLENAGKWQKSSNCAGFLGKCATFKEKPRKRVLSEAEKRQIREFIRRKRANFKEKRRNAQKNGIIKQKSLDFMRFPKQNSGKCEKVKEKPRLASKNPINLAKVYETAAIFIQKFWRGFKTRKSLAFSSRNLAIASKKPCVLQISLDFQRKSPGNLKETKLPGGKTHDFEEFLRKNRENSSFSSKKWQNVKKTRYFMGNLGESCGKSELLKQIARILKEKGGFAGKNWVSEGENAEIFEETLEIQRKYEEIKENTEVLLGKPKENGEIPKNCLENFKEISAKSQGKLENSEEIRENNENFLRTAENPEEIKENIEKSSEILENPLEFAQTTVKKPNVFETLYFFEETAVPFAISEQNPGDFFENPVISLKISRNPQISSPLQPTFPLVFPEIPKKSEPNEEITEEIVAFLVEELLNLPIIAKKFAISSENPENQRNSLENPGNSLENPENSQEILTKSQKTGDFPKKNAGNMRNLVLETGSCLENPRFRDIFLDYLQRLREILLQRDFKSRFSLEKRLQTPIGVSSRKKLALSQRNMRSFAEMSRGNLILPYIDRQIPRKPVISPGIAKEIHEKIAINCGEFDCNYFFAVLDAIDESFQGFRPKKAQYIWEKGAKIREKREKQGNFKEIRENFEENEENNESFEANPVDFEEIVAKSLRKVEKLPDFLCGTLIDKEKFAQVRNVATFEAFVARIREEKMKQMLSDDLRENEDDWQDFKADELEVKLELSELIFEEIVAETAEILRNRKIS